MDFIIGLPKVYGRDCIYMVVEKLTKYVHLFVIPTKYSASQVAYLFFKEVFRLHGLPWNIISDRDNRFLSVFWQELFRLSKTALTPNTSYHPQTYGKTNIVNKWIEGYLKNYVAGQQQAWKKWFHLRENFYNTTHHISIGMSPLWELYVYGTPSFMYFSFGES